MDRAERNTLLMEHTQIVHKLAAKYGRILYMLGISPEDITQELFLQMIHLLERYQPEKCELAPYLYRHLQWHLLSCLRPSARYGIPEAPMNFYMVYLQKQDFCGNEYEIPAWDAYSYWELVDAIGSLEDSCKRQIRLVLAGEPVSCHNLQLMKARRALRNQIRQPDQAMEVK